MSADGTPSAVQVNEPFNHGTFQSAHSRAWYSTPDVQAFLLGKRKSKTTGLGKNQADASVAVKFFHAIVLTAELPTTSGPLALAAKQGGAVVYLDEVAA